MAEMESNVHFIQPVKNMAQEALAQTQLTDKLHCNNLEVKPAAATADMAKIILRKTEA
jgi:hypothetical protein